jgi:hypothetical protein
MKKAVAVAKRACVDCHFLVKEWRDRQPAHISLVTEGERNSSRRGDFAWHDEAKGALAIACYRGVWDQGVGGFEKANRYALLVETERESSCFFFQYRPGMLLPTAKELQEREGRVTSGGLMSPTSESKPLLQEADPSFGLLGFRMRLVPFLKRLDRWRRNRHED